MFYKQLKQNKIKPKIEKDRLALEKRAMDFEKKRQSLIESN